MDGSGGDLFSTYERCLGPARDRLETTRWAKRVAAHDFSPEQLELFLLWFASQGVVMTRPAEDWIRRASKRCIDLGHDELGMAPLGRALHAKRHASLFHSDAHSLAARWSKRGPTLHAERLLSWGPGGGVLSYWKLQEDLIDGSTPFAQLAAEYEVERLSVGLGSLFLATSVAICGPEIKCCLSFLEEHQRPDQAYRNFYAQKLRGLLNRQTEALDALVATGCDAVYAYGTYLEDCLELAASGAALG